MCQHPEKKTKKKLNDTVKMCCTVMGILVGVPSITLVGVLILAGYEIKGHARKVSYENGFVCNYNPSIGSDVIFILGACVIFVYHSGLLLFFNSKLIQLRHQSSGQTHDQVKFMFICVYVL